MAADPIRIAIGWTVLYDAAPIGSAHHVEVPVEVPVNIVFGTMPYAVMMLTPTDIEDFILGFSLTEGVIISTGEIRNIAVERQENGLVAQVDLTPDALRRHLARKRNLAGRTSCGLCGIESLDQLPTATPVRLRRAIPPAAIGAALQALRDHQPLYSATHAAHAAAWCDSDGKILLVREDVGRHNALDKMIGACLRAGHSSENGFALITSRCSFEMVEKTALFGATTLVAISAPTSLAIDQAQALGITLIAAAKSKHAVCFSHFP